MCYKLCRCQRYRLWPITHTWLLKTLILFFSGLPLYLSDKESDEQSSIVTEAVQQIVAGLVASMMSSGSTVPNLYSLAAQQGWGELALHKRQPSAHTSWAVGVHAHWPAAQESRAAHGVCTPSYHLCKLSCVHASPSLTQPGSKQALVQ